ncbi:MAG: bacteriohemerythrin [Bdellovibrionales bacterium]
MPLVTWNQTLASGIPSIDQEHQELIKRINELYQALIDKQEKNEIKKKLHDLVIHTSNHFKNEEEIMFLIKYPKHKEHAKEHEDLRTRIMRLEKKPSSG